MDGRVSSVLQKLLALGAARAAVVDPSQIIFHPEFVQACRQNRCGSYGTNWSCPPAADTSAMMRDISAGETTILFQTVHTLGDPFDYPAMEEARKEFRKLCSTVQDRFPDGTARVMGTGPCDVCTSCTYPAAPCRNPLLQRWNLEAAAVDVTALCEAAGVPYAQTGRVCYTGLLLFSGSPPGSPD